MPGFGAPQTRATGELCHSMQNLLCEDLGSLYSSLYESGQPVPSFQDLNTKVAVTSFPPQWPLIPSQNPQVTTKKSPLLSCVLIRSNISRGRERSLLLTSPLKADKVVYQNLLTRMVTAEKLFLLKVKQIFYKKKTQEMFQIKRY